MVSHYYEQLLSVIKHAISSSTDSRSSIGPPAASCGSQVVTTGLKHSKKAWYAYGAALGKFEKYIEPEIGAAVRNVELAYADIYYQLYMIGRQPETSRPTVMVCCTDSGVRQEVEGLIRKSGIFDQHLEFRLEARALLLEQPEPARLLYGPREPTKKGPKNAPLGLRIGTLNTLDGRSKPLYSTGGVVVQIGEDFYQMTVKHAFERIEARSSQASSPSRGKRYPGHGPHEWAYVARSSEEERILRGDKSSPRLDYVLLPLRVRPVDANMARVKDRSSASELYTKTVMDIPPRPWKVVAVTGSSGALHGTLLPGPAYLRAANSHFIQKLYIVQLQGTVVEGDSGSAVLDEETGGLYGHIVRGCPNTGTVYIGPAGPIFDDLKRRFHNKAVGIAQWRKNDGVRTIDPVRRIAIIILGISIVFAVLVSLQSLYLTILA
ncbi:hypothetical protein PGQ11_009480 [Apiospora arundinis]|uniref:Uncharacterized protein n=1 Tax=Apiospora arundinis TaxID=335852 RepID=A0ABR2II33_9PEZI